MFSSSVWNGDALTSSFLTSLNYLYPLTLTSPSPAFSQVTSCQNSSISKDIDGLCRMLGPWNSIRIPRSWVTDITTQQSISSPRIIVNCNRHLHPLSTLFPKRWLNSCGDVRFLDSKGQGRGQDWSQERFRGSSASSYDIVRLKTASSATSVYPPWRAHDFWKEEEKVVICSDNLLVICRAWLRSHSPLKMMHRMAAWACRLHTPVAQ